LPIGVPVVSAQETAAASTIATPHSSFARDSPLKWTSIGQVGANFMTVTSKGAYKAHDGTRVGNILRCGSVDMIASEDAPYTAMVPVCTF